MVSVGEGHGERSVQKEGFRGGGRVWGGLGGVGGERRKGLGLVSLMFEG